MTRDQIKQAAIDQYKVTYPTMANVRATEVVLDTMRGNLVVIAADGPNGVEESEVTLVYPDGHVTLFATTEELARHIDRIYRMSIMDKLLDKSNFAGALLLLALIGLFIIGYTSYFQKEAMAIIGSIVGAAAGFFFASGRTT